MVEIADIQDDESLEAWLEAMPGDEETRQKNMVALAHRTAMRVLPMVWQWLEFNGLAQRLDLTVMPILRANLICGVAGSRPTPQIKDAASLAAVEADAAAASITPGAAKFASAAAEAAAEAAVATAALIDATVRAAAATTLAATATVAGAEKAAREAILKDCRSIAEGIELVPLPLWNDTENPLEAVWSDLRKNLEASKNAALWAFWIRWYERSLNGETQDWGGLLTDVALIDEGSWEQGIAEIGKRIEELEQDPRVQLRDFHAHLEQLQKQTLEVIRRAAEAEESASSAKKIAGGARLDIEDAHKLARESVSELQREVAAAQNEVAAAKNDVAAFKASYEQSVVSSDAYALWDKKREHHEARKNEAYRQFRRGLSVIGIFLMTLVAVLLFGGDFLDTHLLPNCPAGQTCPSFSSRSIFATVAVLTLLTLGLWFVRLKMKEYLSERHLELDAQERVAFTRTYLGLLSDSNGSQAAQDSQALVYGAIFRPSSDGIIKEEGGLDPSVAAAISKFLSK